MKSAIKLVTFFALVQVAAIPMVLGAADRVLEGKTIKVGPGGGVLTLPNSTDTLVGKNTTDTLTNKTISGSSNTLSNIPNSATTATSANTASAIVARDSSGNFSAGTITGNLVGNVTGTVSGGASSFSGSLSGDVTGTQSSTVVSTVGGKSSSDIATSVGDTQAATNANTASKIVKRDASGNFSAGTVTANLTGNVTGDVTGNVTGNVSGSSASFTGSLSGDVTGTQGSTSIANNVVSNSKLSTVSSGIIKGRKSASTGNVEDLSAADATSLLNSFVGDSGSGGTKGLVPAPGTGDAAAEKFLKADGSWATTPAGFSNPMTTSGDIIYGASAGAATKLSGNTTTTKKVLSQTGDGSASAAPAWSQVDYSDISGVLPSPSSTTLGGVKSLTSTTSKWINSIGTDGTPATSQPAFSDVSGTAAIAQGGTGQTTQQAAINALTGSQSSGKYLRSDGTNATLASIQAGDVPTLNQNTTGTASNVTGTVAIANGGTGQTSKAAAFDALHPMTTTGDMVYSSSGSTSARLPVGSSGQVIKSVGGVPTWATFSGGINYLSSNPDAEADTTGWATYKDAAGASPVDATGGSPNIAKDGVGTDHFSRTTSSPLRGAGSFELAKSANDRQGEGASYDFTIDSADQAKVISISFDYTVSSGTYADGDVTLYLIADPAGTPVIIQPAGYKVQSVTSGTMNKHIATFQTASNSTSYRLALHVSSTSASAYTLKLDNFQVGPQTVQYGAPVTDWVAYTPTVGGSTANGTVTYTTQSGWYRRIGDSVEVNGRININAVTSAPTGELSVSLPSGITIDTSKTINSSSAHASVFYDSSASADIPVVATYSSNVGSSALRLRAISSTAIPTLAASDAIYFHIMLPVTGWSSTVQMSDSTDTRVVAFRADRNAVSTTLAPNGSDVKVPFNSVASSLAYDTHSKFDASNNYYVAPVAGYYNLHAVLSLASTNVLASRYLLWVRKNGSTVVLKGTDKVPSATTSTSFEVSGGVYAQAGDYFEVMLYGAGNNSTNTLSIDAAVGNTYFTGSRISGPSAIAASESVVARATKGASSHTSTGNFQDVGTWTADFDSHGAMSTAGVFTAPIAGKYAVQGQLGFAANTTGLRAVRVLQNTTAKYEIAVTPVSAGATGVPFSTVVSLNAGDTVSLKGYQNSTADLAYATTAGYGNFSVSRIGN